MDIGESYENQQSEATNMKTTKLFLYLLALIMVVGILPVAAFATDSTEPSVTITHISLDPAKDALGFKASVNGSLDAVTQIGFAFRVNGGAEKVYKLTKTPEDGIFSARVKNILANDGGEATLEAYAFVVINGETVKSDWQSTSMKDTLQAVNNAWYTAGYNQTQKAAVKTLCETYMAQTEAWNLGNIFAEPNPFFGTAQGYVTTDGVDLSRDGGDAPSISFVGASPQYAYVKDVFTDKFCFETEINVSAVLNNDGWPKFGLGVIGESEMVKFYVDMATDMTATQVGVVYQPTGQDDNWAGARSVTVSDMSFTGSDTVKLKLIRDGRAYYFYVNDMLALSDELGFKAENGAVGMFSFNTELTATNYTIGIDDALADCLLLAVSEVNLQVGEEAYIADKLSMVEGLTLTWNSDNTDVAAVDNGMITAKGVGSTKVIVTASNHKKAVCVVNVSAAVIDPLKLNLTSTSVKVGESVTLNSVNLDDRTVTYTSGDTSLLTVTETGVISGVKAGYTTVTATDTYGNTDTCYVLIVDDNSEFVVDGDISEWLESGTGKYQGYTFADLEGTNRSVTVYSVLRADGVYIGGEATHNFKNENYATWYWNTNFEVFVTCGANQEQKWVIHNNNSPDVVAKLTTVEQESVYRSTFEMFIPIKTNAWDDIGYARIGWAFKNKGDALTIERANSVAQSNPDWWWPVSHKPDDMSAHWFIYQDGMYEAKKAAPIPEELIYYKQDFDSVEDGALPGDWKFSLGISETAEVVDGKLHLASTKKSQRAGVILDFIPEVDDYAVEFDMTLVSATGSGKWAGLVFDYCNETSYFPYWQAVLGSNGNINVDRRTDSDTYDPVNAITTGKGALSYDVPMHIRIEIDEQIVTYYIDGVRYAQVTLDVARNSGAKLGLTCRGCDVYFDNFEIQELVYFKQDFDSVEDGALPGDWKFLLGISETAEVVDGKLHLASTKKSQRAGVILDFIPEVDDYAVEFDMTLVSATGSGKWAGLVFDYCNETSYFPYWQAVLGSNGNINVDRRTDSDTYDPVNAITTGKGALSYDVPMHIRIEINGQVVTYYIDGIQYAQVALSVARNSGAKLGLTCRGCDVYYDNFKIKASR